MRMSITSHNIRLHDALRRVAERRLDVALGRISARVDHVAITLTDINAQKGGVDKQCRVYVTVRRLGTIVTEGRHENELASIDKALRRARRVILKRLKRRVSRARKQLDHFIDTGNARVVATAS